MIMVRKKEISPQYRRKTTMEATILEIKSPSHFVLREAPNVAMSNEARQFQAMEKRLNQYYGSCEVVYSAVPEKNVIVVVLPEGDRKWYRARVICVMETTSGPSMNCYLLDYGGSRLIRRERMYKIMEEFLSVPFQAVDFVLLGIKPMTMLMDPVLNITYGPTEDWDSASKEYVDSLCENMDAAFIEILGCDSDGCIHGSLHIELNNNKFSLNEALVTQKFALLDETTCESVSKFDAIEIGTMEYESPVCVSKASSPQKYTLENYLSESFVVDESLSMEDLKSPRKSLENCEVGMQEAAHPKQCLSKLYLRVKEVLAKTRPCSRAQCKDAKTSCENTGSSPSGSADKEIVRSNAVCGEYFKTALDFSDKSLWEASAIPAVSIGECIPHPLLRTEEVPFTPLIRTRLRELKFWGPSCIQSVVWPAVLRNRCFAAVAPPASGKTIGYLLPLLSMLVDGTKYQELPAGSGALLLILCSTWRKVAAVYEQCMNLLKGSSKVKVKLLYGGGGDEDQEVHLFNGCDILIVTPPSFLHYLHKKATNFDRCFHIMLDDGDNLIEQYRDEISTVMKDLLLHIKSQKKPSFSLQIGICSERWTKGVAAFADKFLLKPLVFFTSFLEAAVYSRIPMSVHSCSIKTIDFVLLGLLEGIVCPKAIICTRNMFTAKHVQGILQQNAMFSMLVHNEKPHYEVTAIKRQWKAHVSRDSTFILVVTDDVLLSLSITDANCILHYDLPEISRLAFGLRFGAVADYFSSKGDKRQKYMCHVLITDECKVQAPTLVKLMNRMGQDYPNQLQLFAQEQRKKYASYRH